MINIPYHAEKAPKILGEAFYWYTNKLIESQGVYDEIVLLCVGTDRVTGDCLGPIVGDGLARILGEGKIERISVYGTLERPVHAKNIGEKLEAIASEHPRGLLSVVDACLGKREHIGYISVGEGSIRPGAGLAKSLPTAGQIYITGVVNTYSGFMDFETLQNTRLSVVMNMAGVICGGISGALDRLANNFAKTYYF